METILTVKQARYEALIHIIQLYHEQDACVCERLSDLPLFGVINACPPDCERCMWCIARKALTGNGPPSIVRDAVDACAEAEDWLSEFCDDPLDEGAQQLIKQLRNVLERADKRVCLQEGPVVR